jgi:8-oxo-dGTP pyrophosphatase MutT (NUDIX family)
MSNDVLDLDGPNPWQTRTSRLVYDNGRLRLREDRVVQPDGEPGMYTYVELPWPVVAIVPITEDDQVYLVRQWRYPWSRNSWEIPAGHCEADEDPLTAAQRELAEEVGVQAATWESLGVGYASATINARFHLYLARALSLATHQPQREGTEQDMIARPVPLADVIEAALDGRIQHAMTVVGLLRAARRVGLMSV